MRILFELGQWLRAVTGDHDQRLGTARVIAATEPVPLTVAEIREGTEA